MGAARRVALVVALLARGGCDEAFGSGSLPTSFDERLDVDERGVFGEVHRLESEATALYE